MLLCPIRTRHALLFAATLAVACAQTRQAWTTSRIEGTPEPPRPFASEQAFPQLFFNEALELARIPGSQQQLVVERRGRVAWFSTRDERATAHELIDLRAVEPQLANAYGIVLHPRFRQTRQLFVCYALAAGRPDGTRVSRFTLTSVEPLRVDPKSEEIIITWPSGGHNGGSLHFGPDGYLYISTGDSGPASPPDPINTGQDATDLLGSILRIDVDARDAGKNYRVPADNPWVDGKGAAPAPRPELWSFGLRNPWKISFDPANGNLWCGDVGWQLWEMVHLIKRGANYGWSAFEASQPVKPHLASPLAPISPPTVAHPQSEAASITGGFVYRGKQYPELAGAYVYGDYVTGKIWALWHDGRAITRHEEIADTPHAIVTFGQDDVGELYYLHYGDRTTVRRLVRNPRAAVRAPFPRTLSATGLFADVARQQPAAGVFPFSISTPMWQDGAEAARWIALPGMTRLEVEPNTAGRRARTEIPTVWPSGAVLARTLRLGQLAPTEAERAKPIETQLLHYDGEAWNAYAYRWNEHGTDADLVPAEGSEMTIRAAADPRAAGPPVHNYQWRFASRAECLRCHNSRHDGPLAFTPFQLRGTTPEHIAGLRRLDLVDASYFGAPRRGAEAFTAEERPARAWLHVNCASCHSPNAGGSVAAYFGADLALQRMNVVDVAPTQGGFGLTAPRIVDPGNPWNSTLAVRIAKLGSGHMPVAGSHEVDVEGLKRIEDWIARMPSKSPAPTAVATWDAATIERELASVSGAMRVRRAIDDGKLDAAQRTAAFKIAWASPEPSVRDIFERFKPDEQREPVLGTKINPADVLRLTGDPTRGARLVAPEGKLASCRACHVVQGQGRHFGPDLSRIGSTQTAAQILESIVAPSKTIAPLFRATVLETRGGSSHLGFVRARGAAEIVLATAAEPSIKIARADIRAENTLDTSLMPEGLLQGVTAQEAADLVAYLAKLKE